MTKQRRPTLSKLVLRHSFVIRHSCFVILLALSVGSLYAQKRNITEKDLWDFVWIGDPQISPDGSRVAFVRVTVNEKKEGYNTSIWSVPITGGEPPRQLTKGEHDTTPRWSPDGKLLLFLRASQKDGKPEQPQLAMLPMAGGDSFVFTELPKGAGNPVWTPDGKSIAFTSVTNAEDLAKQEKKKNNEKPGSSRDGGTTVEHDSDVRVITRAVYRQDNEGYIDPKHPTHIWIVTAPHSAEEKAKPRQLTTGRFDEENAVWSKDGSQIYFTSSRIDEPYYELPRTDLYSLPAAGGEPVKITTIDLNTQFGPGGGALSLSPDGKQVAFVAATNQPINSYTEPDLWVLDLSPNAKPRNITANFDFDVDGFVIGDSSSPRAGGINKPIWTADAKGLIAVYSKEGKRNVALFDATVAGDGDTGKSSTVQDLTSGNHGVMSLRVTPDASKLVYVTSTPTRINDLFVLDRATPDAAPKQLTNVNDELLSKLNLTEPEEIWYDSFDGKRIQAWLQKPPNFDAHKKYPLILTIHGGPHVAYGHIFVHEFQWMAAKGYLVLYPNPRGSTSYGQEFGNVIQYRYPGDDYKDLMAGVDEVIERGYVDEKKLGVTGGSGGGLLTNWVVGQTGRFAAAVAQRDIASWENWWYTGDFTLFQPNWFRAPPFEDADEYRARSPISYISNVKTPMMFILGEADYRTPPGAGGEQMFRALKFRKIPTVMVRFPNESHELSRSGQPWHRVERLQHIVGWFDHWLLGMRKPEYEIAPEEELPVKSRQGARPAK
ncbi:MAG TPA: S9 family peptidase [Candidatus Udaeobacter sp.]|jgi:dipeptidyl aminopeptidase/acylaminoacyl peptidase|nr:S9 family peptidase [Candidatus Udaeobacter sp.]